eukprot:TRINITY_DN28813_c0_g1_i1.p1 TRINITY_DN28813_c0_g1~~TRINITY_DN28813_c0_g1_i1.p1  ORF type:complete len:576 (+),score=139.06 TRINITY_DN28813_c0_g1_i1:77-1729(+)
MPRRVFLVGSSGGGAATLGPGSDVLPLIASVDAQLRAIGVDLAGVQMVAAAAPLDYAPPTTPATLWYRRPGGPQGLQCLRGELRSVNECAGQEDNALAEAIRQGEAAGVIMISADASGVNARVVAAAAATGIPCVGTGGSSLSAASAAGARVVGCSGGSVATAPVLKAISYTASLCREWGVSHRPPSSGTGCLAVARSSLEGSLPVFVAAMLLRRAAPDSDAVRSVCDTALPSAVGAVAALASSGVGEPAALAGAASGALCAPSPFLAAVLGVVFGRGLPRLLSVCAGLGLPATSTACFVGGLGVGAGLCARRVVAPCGRATELLRQLLRAALAPGEGALPLPGRAALGALLGVVYSKGSQLGAYHAVLFPGILVEMERGAVPLLGAFDCVALCCSGAGVCAAQLVVPHSVLPPPPEDGKEEDEPLRRERLRADGRRRIAVRGLLSNLLLGDMVEAAYPFVERCSITAAGYHCGAAAAGAAVAATGAASSAYLPVPLAALLSPRPGALAAAAATAFAVPCLVSVFANIRSRRAAPRHDRSGSRGGRQRPA